MSSSTTNGSCSLHDTGEIIHVVDETIGHINIENSISSNSASLDSHSDHVTLESSTKNTDTPTNAHYSNSMTHSAEQIDAPENTPATPIFTGLVMSDIQREFMLDDARINGFWPWLQTNSHYHIGDLFQVFGAECPKELIASSSDDLLPLLYSIMEEKASCRKKRLDINTFDDALRLIKDAQNIIVLTGAGCSVSCGIPDFRSKNGIYSRLDEFELEDPQQMFDIKYFRIRPETFYSFAKEIYPSNFKPSPSHMFIKLLEDKGKLLRNYTQNIDTLEKTAGIKNVVQCHGSFATATCIVCGHHVAGTEIEDHIFAQTVPTCPKCHEENDGIMKPDIVFFGEKLPDEFNRIFQEDRKKADLLIVMGSSLKVSPVADVKDLLPQHIPQILINLEALPHMQHFDIQLLGYCDKIIVEICRNLGWELPQAKPLHPLASATPLLDIEPFVPEPAPPQQGRFPHRHLFEGAVDIDNDLQCDASSACSSTDSLSDSSSTNSDTSDEEEMEGNFDNKQDMPCSDHLVDGIARHELKNCTIDVFSENDVDAELALCQKDDLMQNGILSLKRPRSLSPSGFSDLLAEHQTKFSNHGTKE